MQLQTLLSWLPQVAVTSIPGLINQWLASRELEASLSHFPTFNPRKSPRYWTLRFFFFVLPVALFWALIPLIFRVEPPSAHRDLWNWTLWGMAIALGWRFKSVLNASISIASAGVLDFGPLYEGVVEIFRKAIIANQGDKTQLFWADVAKDLVAAADRTDQQNYRRGHRYLHAMLVSPNSEDSIQIELYRRLKAIRPGNRFGRKNPYKETLLLLKWLTQEKLLSRYQLPAVLSSFDCHRCAQQYFPNATKGSRPRS